MRNHKRILGAVLAVATVGGGVALANKDKVDPKLPKEVQPMHGLVGDWKGSVAMNMGGQAVDAKVTISCKATSAGMGIACQSRFIMPTQTLEETDLFGYDPGQNKYHWFAVTSMGETHDHVAEPPSKEGEPIVWVYSGRMDGKPMQEIVKFTFTDDCRTINFTNVSTLDGQQVFSMAGTVNKK